MVSVSGYPPSSYRWRAQAAAAAAGRPPPGARARAARPPWRCRWVVVVLGPAKACRSCGKSFWPCATRMRRCVRLTGSGTGGMGWVHTHTPASPPVRQSIHQPTTSTALLSGSAGRAAAGPLRGQLPPARAHHQHLPPGGKSTAQPLPCRREGPRPRCTHLHTLKRPRLLQPQPQRNVLAHGCSHPTHNDADRTASGA